MNRQDICKKCKEAKHCCNDGADCADFDLTIINQQDEKIKKLEQQLTAQNNINKKLNAENQKLFEKLFVENQKAIEELIKVQMYISDNAVYSEDDIFGREIKHYIDKQIKKLKEDKK